MNQTGRKRSIEIARRMTMDNIPRKRASRLEEEKEKQTGRKETTEWTKWRGEKQTANKIVQNIHKICKAWKKNTYTYMERESREVNGK